MKKALLIIDMQKISFTPDTPRYDSEGVIDRINKLSGKFRRAGCPVIFIQHDGSKQNFCKPNTEEWEILDELDVDPTDTIISKTINDAFYATELHSFLCENKIKEVVITGCATDYCVEATIHGAITNNYKVTVVENGHTTADRPHAKAKTIIDHYNWVWSNLTPTNNECQITVSSEIKI